MRSAVLFAAGVIVGTVIQVGVAQGPRVAAVNHVAIAVPDFDEALKFYTETMGFREAFGFRDADGRPALTYLQVSRDTFIELQPANAQRPAGITHIGLEVPRMDAFLARLKGRGVATEEPRVGRTSALLSNIVGPGGARFELVELRPDSAPLKAMEAWKP
jgi:catechol 2,3-dioxygenase-like lactoylglutathione lyase family enzyme